MKKIGLSIFLVLLLSCPLLAQEKTKDPGGPVQLASGSLNYQRYGPADCGSEAEGYWAADSENYHKDSTDHSGMGPNPKVNDLDTAPLTLPWPYGLY